MNLLLKWVAERLQPHTGLSQAEIAAVLELPPNPALGDVAFPCYLLSRQWKRPPAAIAGELAPLVQDPSAGVLAEAKGPYLNLFFEPARFAPELFETILDGDFAKSSEGEGQRVVIDLSSPNIAKPFGVAHLRSTMIGHALANLYRLSGYKVMTVNHIGDWGTQFGKLMEAYTRWGDEAALQREPIRESLRLYVLFHEEAERDHSLEDAARLWFWKLENGDAEAKRLWTFFVSFSMKEFDRMYARLGVAFDHTLGESFYNDKMAAVVSQLTEQGLLEESDGAQVVRLDEEGMPPCLILKSDGSTIYPTRDLATALYRKREMGADRLLYVVGSEQKLHFQQVFAVLQRMGMDGVDRCEHVAFGLMKFEGRKMSTRKGQVVFLDTVLDEAVAKAEALIAEKNPELAGRREIAEAVGIGAIIFGDLKHGRQLEVNFSLDEALRFEGETGPYLQYTAARAYKLLDKGGLTIDEAMQAVRDGALQKEGSFLSLPAAWTCLKTLTAYPVAIRETVKANEPSILARYLLDAAKDFNRFYHQERILSETPEATRAKLVLVAACAKVIRSGLTVLGLQSPRQI